MIGVIEYVAKHEKAVRIARGDFESFAERLQMLVENRAIVVVAANVVGKIGNPRLELKSPTDEAARLAVASEGEESVARAEPGGRISLVEFRGQLVRIGRLAIVTLSEEL